MKKQLIPYEEGGLSQVEGRGGRFPRIEEKRQPDPLGLLLSMATTEAGLKPCFPHPSQLHPAPPSWSQRKQPNLSIQVS